MIKVLNVYNKHSKFSVKIFEALKNDSIKGKDLYEQSGLKMLAAPLLTPKLKKSIRGGFIEISTVASTLHTSAQRKSSLDSFNMNFVNTDLVDNAKFKIPFDQNVDFHFPNIIRVLRENKLILFNHPDFLIHPNNAFTIYSTIDDSIKEKESNIIKIANRKYEEINKDFAPGKKMEAKNAKRFGSFEIKVRKSYIQDDLTTYEGTTHDMPKQVSDTVDSLFRNASIKNKLFGIHYLNHRLFHEKFQNDFEKVYPTVFISLPILDLHPTDPQHRYIGIGSIFILLIVNESKFLPHDFADQVQGCCKDILSNAKTYLTGYVTQIAIEKLQEVKKQATKAAISQVMARNMSHNIGSHVLSKFKNERDIDFQPDINGSDESQYSSNEYLNDSNDLSWRGQIAYFNEYLKNRMDFLADIATTDPVMETPMYIYKDLLRGIDKNRILLNRISGVSENIQFKFELHCYGQKVEMPLNHSADLSLSIPNETLGAQAFYVLLENIIRNIYKHGNPKQNFSIKIDVRDYVLNKSYYELSIYDTLENNEAYIDSIVKSRNKAFNESILKDNKLRDANLGTIEMDVCATYLRCLPINSVEDSDYDLIEDSKGCLSLQSEPNLIYAYKHTQVTNDPQNKKFTLGYRFYVSKPKEILVIDDNKTFFIQGVKNEDLENFGIKVIQSDNINPKSIFNHQILYYHNVKFDFDSSNYLAQLPIRTVEKGGNIKFDSTNNFIKSVWINYGYTNLKTDEYLIETGNNKIKVEKSKHSFSIKQDDKENSIKPIFIDNHNSNWKNKDQYSYYDMICSHSRISKIWMFFGMEDCEKETIEYLESVDSSIILIDERLQENIVNKPQRNYHGTGGETILADYFVKQKIFIPTKEEVDLNNVSFGAIDMENTVSNNLKKYLSLDRKTSATFIVIHLGVIEKMIKSGEDKSVPTTNKIINKLLGDFRNKLIITSGRGKPNNIDNNVRYIPLALIQNAVETLFDKYLLNKMLYNSRKSK